MSMQDILWIFSKDQAVTSVGSTVSTDTVDVGRANPNLGAGTPPWVNVQVDTDFASSGSATLQAVLKDGATVGAINNIIWSSKAWAVADLKAGVSILSIPLPAEHQRHLALVYVVGTSAMTAGKVNGWIGESPIYSQ